MRNLQIEYKFKLTKKNSAKQVTDHAMQWRGDQASIYCSRVTVTCLTPSLFFFFIFKRNQMFSHLYKFKCLYPWKTNYSEVAPNGVIKGFQMTMESYESLGQRQAENRQTQLRWVNTIGFVDWAINNSYIWVNGAEMGDYMCIT